MTGMQFLETMNAWNDFEVDFTVAVYVATCMQVSRGACAVITAVAMPVGVTEHFFCNFSAPLEFLIGEWPVYFCLLLRLD